MPTSTVTAWSPSAAEVARSLLPVFRRAPYGHGLARAGYDIALAAAAFDQPVSLLFMDDGVWQLLPDQSPAAIGAKSLASTQDSLPLYDIETLYVESASLTSRGLESSDLRDGVTPVDESDMAGFLAQFRQVVSF